MSKGALTFLTLASVALFPWPLSAALALAVSSLEPLVPLAAGIFADTLYYTPQVPVPFCTLIGAACTLVAFFVRSRVRESSIK
ncbi:MAG: hypothetical protein NT108_00325 [Candidatus Kaiserbacteria bacterium]|nr:hypothetical protein [Candidatus Kaiserbacteria bacterium]